MINNHTCLLSGLHMKNCSVSSPNYSRSTSVCVCGAHSAAAHFEAGGGWYGRPSLTVSEA